MARERTSTSRRFHLILTGCGVSFVVAFVSVWLHIASLAHGPQPIPPARKWWACTSQIVTQPEPPGCLSRVRFR